MEEIKDYIFGGALATLAFIGKYLFHKTEKRLDNLEEKTNINERAIALNTQSDADYRENTSKTLQRIELLQDKIYDKIIGSDQSK